MNRQLADSQKFVFDPGSADYLDDPYPTYRVLRDHHPAYFLAEHRLWLITRHADVQAALTNPAVWSSSRGNVVIDAAVRVGRTLGTLDPPRHDELRSVVNKGVTPARVRALLAETREQARERAKECRGHRLILHCAGAFVRCGSPSHLAETPDRERFPA